MDTKTCNERISDFVDRFVLLNQTTLIEEMLRTGIFSVSDIENVYRPFDGQLIKPSICISCKNNYPFLDSETGWCESCYEDLQMPQEIFEWWLVSAWLGKKLLLEGEAVIDNSYGVWWGRTTTGQAISLDYIIEKIFDDVIGK